LAALRRETSIDEADSRPLDPDDPKSPEVSRFLVLDRPRITAKHGLTRAQIPLVEGEVLVGQDTVVLETYDDGRLDRQSDRLTALAGSFVPPAHPRTKLIRKAPRHQLALTWRWQLPDDVPQEDVDRLELEQAAFLITEVWPKTPHPFLRWRSPIQAASAGDSETALRAAVLQLEEEHEDGNHLVDWNDFRSKFKLKPEPAIDLDRLDIEQLHLSRLSFIPIEQLDDDRVLALYQRAREWGIRSVLNRVARLIDHERPSLLVKGNIEPSTLYGELALEAAQRRQRARAESWLARGRQAESPQKRSVHVLTWEMVDLQVKMMLDGPEVWVPSLAVILEKYRGNQEATSAVLTRLINLGLVQVVADPNHPNQMLLDTRILEHYLKRYGPRVTTSTGDLGVAASKTEIWTPGQTAGASSIWTPGSGSPSQPGREKVVILRPGQ
jgi:hypothetical protein